MHVIYTPQATMASEEEPKPPKSLCDLMLWRLRLFFYSCIIAMSAVIFAGLVSARRDFTPWAGDFNSRGEKRYARSPCPFTWREDKREAGDTSPCDYIVFSVMITMMLMAFLVYTIFSQRWQHPHFIE